MKENDVDQVVTGCLSVVLPMPLRRIVMRSIRRWAPGLAADMDRMREEEDARDDAKNA